jgi:hypothetical protein
MVGAARQAPPELDAPTDELQDLYDLAVRKVTSDAATGRIKGSALMTVVLRRMSLPRSDPRVGGLRRRAGRSPSR